MEDEQEQQQAGNCHAAPHPTHPKQLNSHYWRILY
jgi:hypothetical protein